MNALRTSGAHAADGAYHKWGAPILSMLSAAIPLTVWIWTASLESYWLDSPEFTAAVQTLGIPHPPGHPVYILASKVFTLLPLGTIAFRVALASAFAGALAAGFLFRIISLILSRAQDATPDWCNGIIALVTTLCVAFSGGWWFQMVRQEVYALQALLVLVGLYHVIRYTLETTPSATSHRRLYLSAFVLGLGIANHHFIMLTVFPAAIPALVLLFRRRGEAMALPALLRMLGCALLGMLPYIFLPLRSMSGVPVALGGVHSVQDFFWVVSAKVYQKSMTGQNAAYLMDTPSDALMSMMGELGPVPVVMSLAGLYLLGRRRSTRLVGTVILLAAATPLLLRMIMGFDPFNPDYYGYMMPTVSMLAVCAAVFLSVALHVLYRCWHLAGTVSPLLLGGLLLYPGHVVKKNWSTADLSSFVATRQIYDFGLMEAPSGTMVITHYYKLFFALWAARFVDGSRPDVVVVNPLFFGYPGYLAQMIRDNPELKDLAWSVFTTQQVTQKSLSTLALTRPVRVVPSPWLSDTAQQYLLPDGLLYQAMPEPVTLSDIREHGIRHVERWTHYYHHIGTTWNEHETWRFLSWSHYLDAVFFARAGDREHAAWAIKSSRFIGSSTSQINQLEDALADGNGPIDVTPFLLASPSASPDAP